MNVHQFLELLRARRLLLALWTVSIIALTVAYSFVAPKKYIAEASLVADGGAVNVPTAAQNPQSQPTTSENFLATQGDIIASHRVALDVVDGLKLDAQPDFRRAYLADTGGAGTLRDWLADRLLKRNLDVKLSTTSDVISIATSAASPQQAAALANAFAQDYINATIAIKADSARRQALWLDQQVDAQRDALGQAEYRLSQFQHLTDIADTRQDQGSDVETSRLDALSAQLVANQAERADAQSRLQQLRDAQRTGRVLQDPDLLANAQVQATKAEIDKAEVNRAQLEQTLGPHHPQYREAVAELQTLNDSLNWQLLALQSGIEQTAQQASSRAAEIARLIEEQKQRMLAAAQKTDRQELLSRDVQSAKAVYDAALQQQTELTMQSHLDQSNIAMLSAAVPPTAVASPKLLRNVLLSAFLAVLFGPSLILADELRHRRVRSAADLKQLDLVLLSEIPRLERVRGARPRPRQATGQPAATESTPAPAADMPGRVTA